MEEQKKEVKKENVAKTQKYSYDELNNICGQLHQQNQSLIKQIRQMDMTNTFKRLDYLFKVLELSNGSGDWKFSAQFVDSCISEIEDTITIPEEIKNPEPVKE